METDNSLQKSKPTVGWCPTPPDCSLLARAVDTELPIPKPSWQWRNNVFRDKDSLLFYWWAVALFLRQPRAMASASTVWVPACSLQELPRHRSPHTLPAHLFRYSYFAFPLAGSWPLELTSVWWHQWMTDPGHCLLTSTKPAWFRLWHSRKRSCPILSPLILKERRSELQKKSTKRN